MSYFVSEKGYLSIGNYSGISNVVLHCHMKIIIGNHVNIGDGTMIVDTDFHSIFWQDKLKGQDVENAKCSSINIGDFVFIGARSIILKGVTIGAKAVIDAGSVVTRDIPECELWAGNPIRFVKRII